MVSERRGVQASVECTFACDKRDELADALLHAFLRLFGDLGIVWQSGFHDSGDWSKVADVSIGGCQVVGVVPCPVRGRRSGGRIVRRHDVSSEWSKDR